MSASLSAYALIPSTFSRGLRDVDSAGQAARRTRDLTACAVWNRPGLGVLRVAVRTALVAGWLLISGIGSAQTINYALQGTASGNLVVNGSSMPFSNAAYSFSVVADTATIIPEGLSGGGFYTTWTTRGTVSVAGVTGTFSNGVMVEVDHNGTFSSISLAQQINASSYFYFVTGYSGSLSAYDLQSSIGPLSLNSPSANAFNLGVATSFGSFTLTSVSSASFTATPSQSFALTFYGVPRLQSGVQPNISLYTKIFSGTFEIASAALGIPNNLILYRNPAFLAFDVPIATAVSSYDFNLENPRIKFPGDPYPVNGGTQTDPVQGLRLDAGGNPQRFDTPSTFASNRANIRDYTTDPWPGGPRPEFTLFDNDSPDFDFVELADGTLLHRKDLAGRTPVASVAGNWSFGPNQLDPAVYSGIYIIAPAQQPISNATQPTKLLGDSTGKTGPLISTCSPAANDPIDIASGNMFYAASDCLTPGQNPLRFGRYYNSRAGADTFAASLGRNWRTTFDRYLRIVPATSVTAERADGKLLTFALQGSTWTPDTDVDLKLVQAGSTWTLTDPGDTVETYTAVSATEAILTSVKVRNGYTQTLQYNSSNQLQSVTDSFNRSLNFTYQNGLLGTVTTPDNLVLTFGYDSPSSGANRLVSIAYSTSPETSQTYLYENPGLPFALTGITDEDGNRYATWTYDVTARGLATQHGNGADLMTIVYNDADGSRAVTNALGVTDTYTFSPLQGVPKVTRISRAATATTAAATRFITYDGNGYMASQTDWNENQTVYVNDAHGQPVSITEAAGTPQARTTSITYDTTFHLPVKIIQPGITTDLVYDASGNLLTRTLTDTTTTASPYATRGTRRVWTYTWANALLASVKGPRTDVNQLTGYMYDGSGALIQITNALGQVTQVTQHTPGGFPQTIVDPNGVTTQLAYDARLRLTSSTINTASGPLITRYAYDPAGNLTGTTLPDGSALADSYDAAHRLTAVADLFGQQAAYTLDALGGRTQVNIADAAHVVKEARAASFDALGRLLTRTGGAGQVTRYSYDANGNALNITDPLGRITNRAFDPLNRLFKVTDPAGGIATTSFDAHDRPLKVTAPNGAVTTYVYDGFGDLIGQASPDTGTTIYRYDGAGNLAVRIDAAGAMANYRYDALDRVISTTFPADAAENIMYRYDEPGHGFGIGRLTRVADAVGSLSRSYDERGNVTSETRVRGPVTLLASYAYDAAGRIASIAYPSGAALNYGRDAMGRITGATLQPKGAASPLPVASAIGYQPFGPVNAIAFGNGVAETRSFDLDYRLATLADAGTGAVQNLIYGYDAADNVLSIADAVTPANTQTLSYDLLDRLTGAAGAYGSLNYTYDANGNRLTQKAAGVTTSYVYAPQSNRLMQIRAGNPPPESFSYTPAGNVAAMANVPGARAATVLEYNQAGRLATVRSGGQPLIQYAYDAFGQRLAKRGSVTAITLFQYDRAGHLLEQTDGTGSAQVDYIYLGDRPIATYQPGIGKLYFLHDDRLGTPQVATDSAQAVAWTANYEPFGYTSTSAGLIAQDLRLPGQEFEIETGWNHNGFRDYVPTLGRYLESDPIGLAGGVNTYGYVASNPTALVDRDGSTAVCPDYLNDMSAQACYPDAPEGYTPYYLGLPKWARQLLGDYHCGGTAFLEYRSDASSAVSNPVAECVYDQTGNLIGPGHPYSMCQGTPDQYPIYWTSLLNIVPHKYVDLGGPSALLASGQTLGNAAANETTRFNQDYKRDPSGTMAKLWLYKLGLYSPPQISYAPLTK